MRRMGVPNLHIICETVSAGETLNVHGPPRQLWIDRTFLATSFKLRQFGRFTTDMVDTVREITGFTVHL